MNTSTPISRALSRQDAADLLNISESTLDKLIEEGRIRVIRLARRVLIPVDALEDFLRG